jgi:hypothetical protein
VQPRQKEKTLCAPREPQKVLVVELILLYPMCRMFYENIVLTASPDHLGRQPTPLLIANILHPN